MVYGRRESAIFCSFDEDFTEGDGVIFLFLPRKLDVLMDSIEAVIEFSCRVTLSGGILESGVAVGDVAPAIGCPRMWPEGFLISDKQIITGMASSI